MAEMIELPASLLPLLPPCFTSNPAGSKTPTKTGDVRRHGRTVDCGNGMMQQGAMPRVVGRKSGVLDEVRASTNRCRLCVRGRASEALVIRTSAQQLW